MLTERLAPSCRELRVYEIDRRLVPVLRTRSSGTAQVRVIGGDFLAARPPRTPFFVAGNVPFSRTAAIVDRCLRAPALADATLLTQLEYARKRTGDYGSWTLLTVRSWPRHEWRLVGRVARTRFRPVPSVDAGIVCIERRRAPLLEPAGFDSWRSLVELGFSGVGGSLARLVAVGASEAPGGRRVPGGGPGPVRAGRGGAAGAVAAAARGAHVVAHAAGVSLPAS